jgi:hypothetical protein
MELLKTLAAAVSLGALAGVNLYLTVFITGLAARFDWVSFPPALAGLEVLGSPAILAISGALFLVEFLADKIPWVDTAWDSVHTFIRPVGAAALAVAAIGDAHPAFEVAGGLLAGGMALSAHFAKAGTRLAANTSPEPFTNIGLSLAGDGLVVLGLGLIAWSPIVALVVIGSVVGTILFFLPRLLRAMVVNLTFAWKKLTCPPQDSLPASPGTELPHALEKILRRSHASKAPLGWSIACVSRKGSALPANIRGHLAALEGEPSLLHFIGKTWRGHMHASLDVSDATFEFTEGFLTHKLEVVMGSDSVRQAFLFDQQTLPAAKKLAQTLSGKVSDKKTNAPAEG